MKHFGTEDWADFARDVVRKDRKAAMESHLQEGCQNCKKTLELWQRVHSAARRLQGLTPPEGVSRIAKAMYGQSALAKRAKASVAELLFDSFRAPLAAGVRSAAATARQMLYGAGSHRVDVRLEPQVDSSKIVVTGQVLDSAQPGTNLEGLPVRLLSGEKVISESSTTRFGEFLFESVPAEGLELQLRLGEGSEVRFPLALSTAASGPSAHRDDSVGSKGKRNRGSEKRTRKKG